MYLPTIERPQGETCEEVLTEDQRILLKAAQIIERDGHCKEMLYDVVQASFRRAAELALTHPHLGVPVKKDFSQRAADMWKRIRAELGKEEG